MDTLLYNEPPRTVHIVFLARSARRKYKLFSPELIRKFRLFPAPSFYTQH